MADVRPSSGPRALLLGLLGFVVFETAAYWLLRWVTAGLGEANQLQPDNTIVRNWVKTIAFLLLHLALTLAATLTLNNRLPRRYRGQVLGWFYLSLLTGFGLLLPLFSE